jgi:hypothetical protein
MAKVLESDQLGLFSCQEGLSALTLSFPQTVVVAREETYTFKGGILCLRTMGL